MDLKYVPKNKILARTKLEVPVFTDNKFNVAELLISVSNLQNLVGKGENAGNQHFLLFPQFYKNKPVSHGHENMGFLSKELKSKYAIQSHVPIILNDILLLTLCQKTNFRCFQAEGLPMTILHLMKMA